MKKRRPRGRGRGAKLSAMLKQYTFGFYEVIVRLEKLRNTARIYAFGSYSAVISNSGRATMVNVLASKFRRWLINVHQIRKRVKGMSNKEMRVPLLVMIAILLLILAWRFSNIGGFSSPEVDWYYTIPDGYQGFLVIRYDCTNGKPLIMKDGKAYLEFNDDGTACIKDSFQASHGQVFAQQRNGQPVRVASSPWNEKGYAFWTQGTMGIAVYGVDYGTFEIMWAGDMEYLGVHYLEGLDQFLKDRFGIPTLDTTTPTQH